MLIFFIIFIYFYKFRVVQCKPICYAKLLSKYYTLVNIFIMKTPYLSYLNYDQYSLMAII